MALWIGKYKEGWEICSLIRKSTKRLSTLVGKGNCMSVLTTTKLMLGSVENFLQKRSDFWLAALLKYSPFD